MTPPPIIGLVGGIGAGKSFVAKAFVPFGGVTVDGDAVGHLALQQPALKERVRLAFGDRVLKPDGEVDRRALGRIVFGQPAERAKLEAIVLPWIGDELRRRMRELEGDPKCRFIILDAAIMLEAGWNGVCDKLLFVDAPLELRLARVAERGWTADDLRNREASQLPVEQKRLKADGIIFAGPEHPAIPAQIEEWMRKWGWWPAPVSDSVSPAVY